MTNWKAIAIVFIILFVLLLAFVGLGAFLVDQEDQRIKECYYEICADTPEAQLVEDICYCYDYDKNGEWEVVNTHIMR